MLLYIYNRINSVHSINEFEKEKCIVFVSNFRPDVQHFLEKLKREREEKLIAQENDNRPFVLKYVSRS